MAIEKAGYKPDEDFQLVADAASSEFYDKEKGLVHLEAGAAPHGRLHAFDADGYLEGVRGKILDHQHRGPHGRGRLGYRSS